MVFLGMCFQFCSSSKKTMEGQQHKETMISYNTDLKPLILRSCSPCHFPEKGRVKFLDTYSGIRNNIAEILIRVQLPVHNEKFMPYLSKKQALSSDEIGLIKTWVAQKMPE